MPEPGARSLTPKSDEATLLARSENCTEAQTGTPTRRNITSVRALISAAPGTVNTHAQTTLPATPQRTADSLRTLPTPTIAPVMVCVVETGTPSTVTPSRVMAPAVSAQQPPTGSSLVIFMPIVF